MKGCGAGKNRPQAEPSWGKHAFYLRVKVYISGYSLFSVLTLSVYCSNEISSTIVFRSLFQYNMERIVSASAELTMQKFVR